MSHSLPEPVSVGLRSLIPSIVRTIVPLVVALLVKIGLAETALDTGWIENVLTIVVTMGYYVVVRFLEQHWSSIGWLLGYPKQPVYVEGTVLEVTEVPTPPTTTTKVETDVAPDSDDLF